MPFSLKTIGNILLFWHCCFKFDFHLVQSSALLAFSISVCLCVCTCVPLCAFVRVPLYVHVYFLYSDFPAFLDGNNITFVV